MKVIMFHSVGNNLSEWNRSFLSVSLSHFNSFCSYLKKNNYQTIFLDDWYALQNDKRKINDTQIVLTFDDGYLDNWTFAYPILKKFGLKGTVFVNPEFVDPSINKRKNLEDVDFDQELLKKTDKLGFLNWSEMKEMVDYGVMDVQSHSMSHNRFYKSNKIIDIYSGQDDHDWLAWIAKPERKPYYMAEDQKKIVPFGYPVFENGRALGIRRYFPDKNLIEKSIELSQELTGKKSPEQKEKILKELNSIERKYPGRYETDEEMEDRYRYELSESKRILEENLEKPVQYLCWPGGEYNDISIALSKEAGYKASTLASKEKKQEYNNSNYYKRIPRFGMGSFVYKNGQKLPARLNNHLVLYYKAKIGGILPKIILKLQKLFC